MTRRLPLPNDLMKRLTQLPERQLVHAAPAPLLHTSGRSGLGNFGDAGQPRSARGILKEMSASGVVGGGAGVISLRRTYPYQSYFDSALMERAILAQPPSEPIVRSTFAEEPTPGFGVGLYSASESPVAVQLLLGNGKSGSATFVLRPGEVFMTEQRFEGIRYGLPFGWLGGGTVQLRIFPEKDDKALFIGAGAETMFHRIRLPIWAVTDNPLVAIGAQRGVSANWPIQFPWINAFNRVNSPQNGQPSVVVDPTKIVIRLRKAALAAASRVRLLLLQTDDFDLQSDGATYDGIATSGTWVDFQFPATTASGVQINGVATAEFPIVTLDDEVMRVGGGSALAICIDMDGTIVSTLGAPVFVDIERFGLI